MTFCIVKLPCSLGVYEKVVATGRRDPIYRVRGEGRGNALLYGHTPLRGRDKSGTLSGGQVSYAKIVRAP